MAGVWIHLVRNGSEHKRGSPPALDSRDHPILSAPRCAQSITMDILKATLDVGLQSLCLADLSFPSSFWRLWNVPLSRDPGCPVLRAGICVSSHFTSILTQSLLCVDPLRVQEEKRLGVGGGNKPDGNDRKIDHKGS